jgi:hypothetical protein
LRRIISDAMLYICTYIVHRYAMYSYVIKLPGAVEKASFSKKVSLMYHIGWRIDYKSILLIYFDDKIVFCSCFIGKKGLLRTMLASGVRGVRLCCGLFAR